MISYINIISEFFPKVQCYAIGDGAAYNTLIHSGGDPIPSIEALNVAILSKRKIEKITAFSDNARNEIVNGFLSSALGTSFYYDSQPEDQLNLVGVVASFQESLYPCRSNGPTSPKEYRLHTHAQLLQILYEGKNIKLVILEKFNNKKALVISVTTIEELDTVVW